MYGPEQKTANVAGDAHFNRLHSPSPVVFRPRYALESPDELGKLSAQALDWRRCTDWSGEGPRFLV